MDESTRADLAKLEESLYRRDPTILLDLPVRFRWEFTRRHAYYQMGWRLAPAVLRAATQGGETDPVFSAWVLAAMKSIGVAVEPDGIPDPATEFDQLDVQQNAWVQPSSVRPILIRDLVAILLSTIPKDDGLRIVEAIRDAVLDDGRVENDDAAQTQQRYNAIRSLLASGIPYLTSELTEPFFWFHLNASQRQIEGDLAAHLARLRAERGLVERRVPVSKLEAYLNAFDAIEGWRDGGYQREDAATVAAAAARLGIPRSTCWSRYSEAFRLITGHPYQLDIWWRIFAQLKIAMSRRDGLDVDQSYLARRAQRAPSTVPIAESRVFQGRDGTLDALQRFSGKPTQEEWVDDRLELANRIADGQSDEEIAEALGAHPSLIAQYRDLCAHGVAGAPE